MLEQESGERCVGHGRDIVTAAHGRRQRCTGGQGRQRIKRVTADHSPLSNIDSVAPQVRRRGLIPATSFARECCQPGASHIIVSLPGTKRRHWAAVGRVWRDGERRMILDVNEIQKLLPHRYPFLMIDGILEMERLKSIVGVKNVTINEQFFQGHFPGKPIMPGVLIIEAMAQTGGLLLLLEIPERESKLLYFVAVDKARFRRPVVPDDQLKLEVKVLHWRGGDFAKPEARATVDGNLCAEATLMCKMVDRDPQSASEAKTPTEGQKAPERSTP